MADVKEKPILFSAPMVRALLDGRKTQTRRVVKPQPIGDSLEVGIYAPTVIDRDGNEGPGKEGWGASTEYECIPCPYGKPGDRLWVRESFQPLLADGVKWRDADYKTGAGYAINYVATGGREEFYDCATDEACCSRVTPSIFMPRWASRITLEITEVRVERLQDISGEDSEAEGVFNHIAEHSVAKVFRAAREFMAIQYYRELWESINGAGSWDANPWVWALTFRKLGGTQ